MKSIERRFNDLQQKQPNMSSYINFSQALTQGNFAPITIHRWFSRLVEKDDYEKKDKRAIYAHLNNLSNPLRTTRNEGESVLCRSQIVSVVVQNV